MVSLAFSCRLCLEVPSSDALVFSVFDTHQGRVLVELIDELFSIKIVEYDRLVSVCLDCVNRINTVRKIHELFIENNRKLQELLRNDLTTKSSQEDVVYEVFEVNAPNSESAPNQTNLHPEVDQLVELSETTNEGPEQENATAQRSESSKPPETTEVIISIEEATEDDFDLLFVSDNENSSVKDSNEDQCVEAKTKSASSVVQLPQNKCYFCSVIFESALEFTNHLPEHFTQTPYSCLDCNGLVFRTVREASKHIGLHDIDERPFKCRICSLRFPTRSNSLTHERKIHRFKLKRLAAAAEGLNGVQGISQRPKKLKQNQDKKDDSDHVVHHQCQICPKTFTAKKNLTRHLMVHTGEKPFKCAQCIRSFRQAGELKAHQRVHQQEKPYLCGQCDNAYRNSSMLSKHTKSVHLAKLTRRQTNSSVRRNEK